MKTVIYLTIVFVGFRSRTIVGSGPWSRG